MTKMVGGVPTIVSPSAGSLATTTWPGSKVPVERPKAMALSVSSMPVESLVGDVDVPAEVHVHVVARPRLVDAVRADPHGVREVAALVHDVGRGR